MYNKKHDSNYQPLSSIQVSQTCQRERRREAARSQKISKEAIPRARRMAKEV